MKRVVSFFREEWSILAIFGVLLVALAGCVWWGAYESHFKEKWQRDAQIAKAQAEMEVRKQELLSEVREFVAGKRPLGSLSTLARDMLRSATEQVRPDLRDSRSEGRGKFHPELLEIVPGLRDRGITFKDEPLPSREEYQRRVAAFFAKHREIYCKQRDRSEVSYEEYLRIDHRELRWLDTMGHRLNDSLVGKVKEVAVKVPMVEGAILALRLVEVLGSGQHGYAANCKGFNPNERHSEFSGALIQVLVAGGHDYYVPNGEFGNGILMPPPHEKPGAEVHQWGAVFNPRVMGRHLSYSACSVEPTVLTDLTGRVVALQIGKDALRVTFYDAGFPEKLTPALLRLAELLGVKPEKADARWERIDDTSTWELKLGA
ncbi:MAG: hypothetical protein PHE68_01120 [Candidatus Peribacteraceae bacterium]|nr:hypothetical protein [Candidatus Peribacteraceae bacterium]MDD5074421.1 hypothetical protein [Candidatus Peribacteraceae bacterium]